METTVGWAVGLEIGLVVGGTVGGLDCAAVGATVTLIDGTNVG